MRRLLLAVLVLLAPITASHAESKGGWTTAVRTGDYERDLFVAGGTVTVDSVVKGDIFTAGGQVTVAGETRGDVFAAGGAIEAVGNVGKSIIAAGGTVTVSGDVGDKVIAAGGRVRLAKGANIAGKALIAAGTVEIDGHVAGNVSVTAGSVLILGRVDGDVEVNGGRLELAPGAVVRGNVSFRGPNNPVVAPGATIGGALRHVRVGEQLKEGSEALAGAMLVGSAWSVMWLLVRGAALFLVFPDFTRRAAGIVRAMPWFSLGVGFGVLCATPVAAVMMLVTIVGIPLSFAAMAVYFLLLTFATPVTLFAAADLIAQRWLPTWRDRTGPVMMLFTLCGMLLVLLLSVPVVGWLFGLFALVAGVGALCHAFVRG